MNEKDAKLLKNKFDDLMQTVEIFGNESKQLQQTHESLDKLILGFLDVHKQLTNITKCCQKYLNAVDKLVTGNFTQQINQNVENLTQHVNKNIENFTQQIDKNIEKTCNTFSQCWQQYEELIKQYQDVLASFEKDTKNIYKRENVLLKNMQEMSFTNAQTIEQFVKKADSMKIEFQENEKKERENFLEEIKDVSENLFLQHQQQYEQLTEQSHSILSSFENDTKKIQEHWDSVLRGIQESSSTNTEIIKQFIEKIEKIKIEFQKDREKEKETFSTEIKFLLEKISNVTDNIKQLDRFIEQSFKEQSLTNTNAIQKLTENIDYNFKNIETKLHENTETQKIAFSTEVTNLLEGLSKVDENIEQLQLFVKQALLKKTTELKEEQEKNTEELLEMINNVDQKLDKLSVIEDKTSKLLLEYTSKNYEWTSQLDKNQKKQQLLTVLGFGILIILIIIENVFYH